MKLIYLYFFVIGISVDCFAQSNRKSSPCPSVFSYENDRDSSDTWHGTLRLQTSVALHGITVDVIFDRRAATFGAYYFKDVSTSDYMEYRVEDKNYRLDPGKTLIMNIYVRYESYMPNLKQVRLNGQNICTDLPVVQPIHPSDHNVGGITTRRLQQGEIQPATYNYDIFDLETTTRNSFENSWNRQTTHSPTTTNGNDRRRDVYGNDNSRDIYNSSHRPSSNNNNEGRQVYPTNDERTTKRNSAGSNFDYESNSNSNHRRDATTSTSTRRPQNNGNNYDYNNQRESSSTTTRRPSQNSGHNYDYNNQRESSTTTTRRPSQNSGHNYDYEYNNNRVTTTTRRNFDNDYDNPRVTSTTRRSQNSGNNQQDYDIYNNNNKRTTTTEDPFEVYGLHNNRQTTTQRTTTSRDFYFERENGRGTTKGPSYFQGDLPFTNNNRPTTHSILNVDDNACGSIITKPNPLIVHGEETFQGQFPWHSALYLSEVGSLKYICGGSLVSMSAVITAAHCVTHSKSKRAISSEKLLVYLGKQNLQKWSGIEQDAKVADINVNHEYNPETFFSDLAILRLKESLRRSNYVRPVCVWGFDDDLKVVVNKLGAVPGWGYNEEGVVSETLSHVKMPVVTHETCIWSNREFFSKVTSDKSFCAGFKNGTTLCGGDSGGGMVFKQGKQFYLRGIVSISIALQNSLKCDANHYVVFVDAAKYSDWIKDNI